MAQRRPIIDSARLRTPQCGNMRLKRHRQALKEAGCCMYTERQMNLCMRILRHCRTVGWYGPEGENPALDSVQRRHTYDIVTGRHYVGILPDDRRLTGFAFPHATEAQLAATEQTLGFPLPPMLRTLYTLVANGGFGPGLGITGARGGYYFEYDRDTTIDGYTDSDPVMRYFNLMEYEAAHGLARSLVLPPQTWPAHFLQVTYWGCAEDTYIDASSGRLYFTGCWNVVEKEPGDDPDVYMHLLLQEESLEDWLETWLTQAEGATEYLPRRWFDHKALPLAEYIPPDPLGRE
jgi:hypothetical protein